MAGYVPIFDSVFNGTLCGKWPTLPVWLTILPMADKNGVIDMTPQAMSAVTGWPIDLLKQALEELCAPDPESRSDEHEGRRLELIDAHRSWGWRVVNHGKYREKARKQMQQIAATESGRDAERKRVERERQQGKSPAMSSDVQSCPAVSGYDRPSDSDSDSDSDKKPVDISSRDLNGGSPRASARRPRDKKSGSAFPVDFALSDTMRQQALSRYADCDADEMFVQFRAHHEAHGKAMKSWPAAWITWLGNAAKFGYPKRGALERKWE